MAAVLLLCYLLLRLQVEALAGEVMMQLAMHPNLLLPRI